MASPTTAPHASAGDTPEESLANRYGGAQRRPSAGVSRRMRLTATIAVAAAVLVTAWFALSTSIGRVTYKEIGYEVVDDHLTRVSFQVTAPAGKQAECDIEVQDSQAAPVGYRTVLISGLEPQERSAPGDDTWTYTVDVRTVVRGNTGVVETCRAV
ncbi:DUF4307 domain-containing protein [Micrococcus luteus]